MRKLFLLIPILAIGYMTYITSGINSSIRESCTAILQEHADKIMSSSVYRRELRGIAIVDNKRSDFLCLTENHKADMLLVDNHVIWRR